MSHRIQDIPEQDRPRERLLRLGPAALSDAELLAIFINTGVKGENAIQVARRLLGQVGSLRDLSRQEPESLVRNKALGPAKAANLAAAFELGRRAEREALSELQIQTPEDVYRHLGAEMQALPHESVRVILLNTRFRVVRIDEVFKGALNESVCHPREIMRKAIVHNAHAFVLVHNHPSGDPAPSDADVRMTRSLRDAAALLKIELVDHIIIGSPGGGRTSHWFSFKEAGML
ncbi:MAG: DNA repair protein RadC [Verrucomicrobiaceae bacterium]|nr:DNA repair protein RadC [Verrucomicrobiaceae bacterium]